MPLRPCDDMTMRSDPLIDSLRKEPRFQEIERKLNFPN